MVSSRFWLLIVFGLLIVSRAFAVSSFSSEISASQVEYGKFIELDLSAPLHSPPIENLDLTALRNDFHLDVDAKVQRASRQIWTIRLYPRGTGTLVIPALQHGQLRSEPVNLKVVPPIDPKTGQILNPHFQVSDKTAWLNQHVTVLLDLQSRDEYVVLETSVPSLAKGRLLGIPQQHYRHETNPESQQTSHSLGWIYIPNRPGTHTLELPPIAYKRDGIITHRFYLPIVTLAVQPLPHYVPATYPVGKLTLQLASLPRWTVTNKLQQLQFRLYGQGITPARLPRVSHFLQATDDIQIYPMETIQSQVSTRNGMTSQAIIAVPFKTVGNGLLRFPEIRLPYFDPTLGKIQILHYKWPYVLSLSLWFLVPLLLISLYILITVLRYLSAKLFKIIWRIINCYKARQKLLASRNIDEIQEALLLVIRNEQYQPPMTLAKLEQCTGINTEALCLIRYRGDSFDINTLKSQYLKELKLRYVFS